MSAIFFDSNMLLYSVDKEDWRRTVAADAIAGGGAISVQCLNEFTSVAHRKLGMSWDTIVEAVDLFTGMFDPIVPLTLQIHRTGVQLSRRYLLSVYDGLIVAAALHAKCDILYSEDMHDGLFIADRLRIMNAFAQASR